MDLDEIKTWHRSQINSLIAIMLSYILDGRIEGETLLKLTGPNSNR